MTSEMEKILGAPIGWDDSSVPGTKQRDGTEFLYFSDNGNGVFMDQFHSLFDGIGKRQATHGGMISQGCTIRTPDNTTFYAISYRGDLDGWRADIQAGAALHGSVLAYVENDRLIVADGRSFALSDCEVIFT